MRVDGIDHINVLVRDENLEKAMDFFCDVFGSKFIGPIDHRPQLPIRIAIDDKGFALQSPTSQDHPFAKQIQERGEGISSIAYRVPDIHKGVAELKAHGLKPLPMTHENGEIVELPWIKSALFSGENAFGCQIELVEYKAASPVTIANANMVHDKPWFKKSTEPILKAARLDHVHIFVSDIEMACAFFSRVFDAHFVLIDQTKRGLPMKVAFDKATQIELIMPERGEVEMADIIELLKQGVGLSYIGFYISNLKEGIKGLLGRGMKLVKYDPKVLEHMRQGGGIPDLNVVEFTGENAFGCLIELLHYDIMSPVAQAHLGTVSQLPWFTSNKD